MEHQPRDRDRDSDDAARDLTLAIDSLGDMIARLAYAAIAAIVTIMVVTWGFHLPHDHAVELGTLNGGLAYYSHAATGRVVRTLYRLARANGLRIPRRQNGETNETTME